jgi:hypothetical protein
MTLVIVPSRCRRSDFAALDALEHHRDLVGDLIGLSNISRVSMGVPWSHNSPIDENREGGSTALHCHTAAVDAPYLRADDAPSPLTVPLCSGGARRDVIRKPIEVAAILPRSSAPWPDIANAALRRYTVTWRPLAPMEKPEAQR